jgi:hypothetical protein
MNQQFNMGYTLTMNVDSGKFEDSKCIRMNGSFSSMVIIIQCFAALTVCSLLMKWLSLSYLVFVACPTLSRAVAYRHMSAVCQLPWNTVVCDSSSCTVCFYGEI